MSMRFEHSPDEDALYVAFDDRDVAYTVNISCQDRYERGIDYGADGTPIGVEFLYVSRGVDLTDVPRADEIARLLREHQIRELA